MKNLDEILRSLCSLRMTSYKIIAPHVRARHAVPLRLVCFPSGEQAERENKERVEIGFCIVDIDALFFLQVAHYPVGERGRQRFVARLHQPVRQYHYSQSAPWHRMREGDEYEQAGVQRLSYKRGAYGARPQPAAFGGDLHLCQHKRVGELACEIADEGGCQQPGREAEYRFVGSLALPEPRRRQQPAEPYGEDGEQVAQEAEPDDLSGGTVAVNLGEDVAEDVADGENDDGGGEVPSSDGYYLYGDDVGDDETGDKYACYGYESGGVFVVHCNLTFQSKKLP